MTRPPPPTELADALARITQAKRDYSSLVQELQVFLYEHVKGMVKGRDPDTGNFTFQLRHPKDSTVTGAPPVLISQIVENLRTSLDYMVFQLSRMNDPALDEHVPQFVIAASKSAFKRQKRCLRYLTDEQRSLVEQLQPFSGNKLLGLLNRIANTGKHRSLLTVRDATSLEIYFAEAEKRDQYDGSFEYPMEEGMAIFARPSERLTVILLGRYDALRTLEHMIEHVESVLRTSFCFFRS